MIVLEKLCVYIMATFNTSVGNKRTKIKTKFSTMKTLIWEVI